ITTITTPYVEVALQAPPSPDYMPGLEEPEQAPPSPDYVPGPEHADDEIPTPPLHLAYRTMARISIPALVPMPAWTDSEIARLLAISSPPASPLSPWSSPPPQIPFPPLPPILSPPSPILAPAPPPSPIRSLGYRAAMIRLRDEAASILPPSSQLPSASRREDRPEVTLPPRRRLGIALGPRYEVGLCREHQRSTETSESRTALQGQITALKGQVTALQAQVATLQEHQGQQRLAGDPTQLEPPEEAGGSA
nr:hypothetical protein [Tanacetum cinerariifolium]